MTRQLAMPDAVLPEPVVDQVTAAHLARTGSATAEVAGLFCAAWEAAGGVHERRRLVALRDHVLGVVGGVEEECEVAHRLMGGDEGGAHG